ncbi:lactose permease [Thozetella sp. PMI_491]|nr:lactose permease [Thozetella sp. PMI_491]
MAYLEAAEARGSDGEKSREAARSNNVPELPDSTVPAIGAAKEVKVLSVELTDAIAKDQPNYRSKRQIQLLLFMLFTTMNGCMSGYDGSVMSSVNAMNQFHDYFGVGKVGPQIGLIMAIYTAGQIVGSFFTGFALDTFGRRGGMVSGSLFIIVGAIVQSTSTSLAAFIAGRFIVGLGVPVVQTAAPTYIVEMAYPTWRGMAGGFYNVLGWYIGSNIASWSCYGTANIPNDWSWRIPHILQAVPAVFMVVLVYFVLPESPRWLWQKGKPDKARAILVKYHGNGREDSALVALECQEIQQSVEYGEEHDTTKWYNYKILFSTRANIYRMYLIFLLVVFMQFTGGAVISYYLPSMMETVGMTDSKQQLLVNALNNIFSFVAGLAGATQVDRWGRRPLMLWGIFLSGLVYIPINVLGGLAGGNISTASGYAFIAMLYCYGMASSFCITPLQALYPAEILPNDIRAKGIAADKFVAAIFSFINLYLTPIALKNIGWKAYTIFLVLHVVHWFMMYQVTVETKGRSLEEIEEIFNDRRPVKRSKQFTKVVVSSGVGVKAAEDEQP